MHNIQTSGGKTVQVPRGMCLNALLYVKPRPERQF